MVVSNTNEPDEGRDADPAVRFAARETLKALNGEEKSAAMRRIEQMERDAQRLIDMPIPTRSQDGRNLAYHGMMAEGSSDVTYRLSRARRAMAIPEKGLGLRRREQGLAAECVRGTSPSRRQVHPHCRSPPGRAGRE